MALLGNRSRVLWVPLIWILVASCAGSVKGGVRERIASIPAKNLKSYELKMQSHFTSRIQPAPEFVIRYLREVDGNETYSTYHPSKEEIDLIDAYLSQLPPLHKRVLQDWLIGIYLVNDFQGSGWADYVLDESDNLYAILIFNPVVLKEGISELLTRKENSCFIQDDPRLRVEIDCGKDFRGLMYILLHETSHIVDYLQGHTPYVEEEMRELGKALQQVTPFVSGVWAGYAEPTTMYDFPFRKEVTFYGLNQGPRIRITDAMQVYEGLAKAPFVSLYGSMNWAEDFAEFITFYHLTNKLGQPYEVKLLQGNEGKLAHSPIKAKRVLERSRLVQAVYAE